VTLDHDRLLREIENLAFLLADLRLGDLAQHIPRWAFWPPFRLPLRVRKPLNTRGLFCNPSLEGGFELLEPLNSSRTTDASQLGRGNMCQRRSRKDRSTLCCGRVTISSCARLAAVPSRPQLTPSTGTHELDWTSHSSEGQQVVTEMCVFIRVAHNAAALQAWD
jgi:hypothetical protein